MIRSETIEWLLAGDPAIAFQARRDLLGTTNGSLQARIANEGWGKVFLDAATPEAGWGRAYYAPKWISTHYTLYDLRLLELPPANALARRAVARVLSENQAKGGGVINDTCVNGMFLDIAAWFGAPDADLRRIVDYILVRQITDGGFNCDIERRAVHHSSMHTTICVLEGFRTYEQQGYDYRIDEIRRMADEAREFLLTHRLFRARRTGAVINDDFLRFPVPPRYKYNVLRALDHFRAAGLRRDPRMDEALDIVISRRKPDGRWHATSLMSGLLHQQMEKAGQPGRWPTLIAMRVLAHFGAD